MAKLEPLPDYPGMYFIPQYWFSLSSESWKILYNLPLKPLETRITLITDLWKQVNVAKSHTLWVYLNEPRWDLMKHSWDNVQGQYKQLKELLVHNDRVKRGIFNTLDTLGRGVKLITGNMDADDEQYFNEKIDTIALDNKRIHQLERDQLTVIQSTLWAVNKTSLNIQENQEALTKAYKYLDKIVDYNTNQIKNLTILFKRQEEILQELSLLQDLIRETETVLRTLYDAIDTARTGRLSSFLVTPNELIEILEHVKSHLHLGDSLPIAVSPDTVYGYYDLVKIIAYFSDDNLRYVITIPLHHIARNFHLFKVIQVPNLKPSSDPKALAEMYVIPEKTVDYIAFSENLQYYTTPSYKEVQECTPPPHRICSSIHIIYPVKQGDNNRCEIDLFRNFSYPHCNFKLIKIVRPVWENIPNSNTWIFAAVPDNERVTITCKNNNGIMAHVTDLRLKTRVNLLWNQTALL